MPSGEESTPKSSSKDEESQEQLKHTIRKDKTKMKKRGYKTSEGAPPVKRSREAGGTPSSSKYDLWKDFCERGADVFKTTHKKIAAMEKEETKRDLSLQKVFGQLEAIEKNLANYHKYVVSTASPTSLIIQSEQMDELIKRLTTRTTEMQNSLEMEINSGKQRILSELEDVYKEVDSCRSEVQKTSNNAVMHETRELSTRMNALKSEVMQQFEVLEKNQRLLPEILSTLKDINTRLTRLEEASIHKEEAPKMVENLPIYEETLLIDEDSDTKQEEEREEPEVPCLREANAESGEIDLTDDKEIRDALAAVNKDLMRKKHEIFSLNHRIEELKKNSPKHNQTKITEMRKEKYELVDEEIALTKRKHDLEAALYDWTKSGGSKKDASDRRRHKDVVATSHHRRHGSISPSRQKESPRRDHRMPRHSRQSHSSEYGRRGI